MPGGHEETDKAAQGLADENNALRIQSLSPTHNVLDKLLALAHSRHRVIAAIPRPAPAGQLPRKQGTDCPRANVARFDSWPAHR